MATRLSVLKTYKLFIGGKFPRTESGRRLTAMSPGGEHLAHYCHASRKDFRDAVVAARAAASGWAGISAYLRGQILYRLAEMLESRRAAFVEEIVASTGCKPAEAAGEVSAAVDRCVYYAGWTDKIQQVMGAVNPVASTHFNFTVLEPTGVVALVAPERPCLLGAIALLAPALAAGNATILLASSAFPLPSMSLAEALATSDVPGGVVNILTGPHEELLKPLAEHMDLNAIVDGSADAKTLSTLRAGAGLNLKRVTAFDFTNAESPERVTETMEAKTAWHPIGV
jgi:acyl-CoA reductase-like NAD-dependent aldehyde dehydrogenase